jgi:hypothetical protein
MRLAHDGAVYAPRIGTTVTAANAYVDNGTTPANKLLRSTSSLRHKNVVGALELMEARNVVLNAQPIKYRSLCEHDDRHQVFVGLGAETMGDIDDRFITRDADGRPNWVQYPALTAPLIVLAQDHEERLAALERGMNAN